MKKPRWMQTKPVILYWFTSRRSNLNWNIRESPFSLWRNPSLITNVVHFVNQDWNPHFPPASRTSLPLSWISPVNVCPPAWSRVFSEPKWKSGQLKSRWNRGKIGTIYEENRSISGQKTSQIMFFLSFYQANLYAPIFLQDKNANSEHIRGLFPFAPNSEHCSDFRSS